MSQILSFLEFENPLFNIFSDFSKITEILKLKWVVSGSDLATVLPQTTSLYLSRKIWSNSATKKLPPKCSEPKISKSPCICLGNEKCPKKSVCKWPKNVAVTFKTSTLTISDNFSINKSHQKHSQRLPTKKKKNSDFAVFRVRKSNFQSRLWFFGIFLDFKTQMGRLRKWLGTIFAQNN